MTTITATDLVDVIEALSEGQSRILVAIAGPPGSGKTTLAADLAARLGPTAAVLPMDGFHLDNDRLHRMGLFHRKGAPETFDAEGFVKLLQDIRVKETVPYPSFDRQADRTIPDGGRIEKGTRIVLVEGNYLLLNRPPWSELADCFDLTVRLDVSREALKSRLVARWLDHGLSAPDAEARAVNNDMTNADFVENNATPADYTIRAG